MVRILWINPVGAHADDASKGAGMRAGAAPAARVDVGPRP